jgi:DNA-binding MarR family transcriptional regulator
MRDRRGPAVRAVYLCKLSRVPDSATPREALLPGLERLVVASVAITARSLAEVAPELTFVQWRALVLVSAAGDGLAMGLLAAALGSKIAAASRLVGRLRARGLLETRRADDDARVVLVSLTRHGRELHRRVVDRRRRELAVAAAAAATSTPAEALVGRLADVLEGTA